MVWIWNTDPSIKHACIIAILKSINMILAPIPSYFFKKKIVIIKADAKPARFERDRIPNGQQKQSRTHSLYVTICSGFGIHQTGMYAMQLKP